MSIPFNEDNDFASMSLEEKFDWLRTSIPVSTWLERSGASILSELRDDYGFTIGDGAFYEARRQVIAGAAPNPNIVGLSEDDPIPVGYMDVNTDFIQSRNYLYQFKISGVAIEDGERSVRFYSIASDEQLTRQQAEIIMYEQLRNDAELYGIRVSDAQLNRVFRRP